MRLVLAHRYLIAQGISQCLLTPTKKTTECGRSKNNENKATTYIQRAQSVFERTLGQTSKIYLHYSWSVNFSSTVTI